MVVVMSLIITIILLIGYKYVGFIKITKDKAIYRYQVESDILYQWLAYKQMRISITDYFHKRGWKRIALYGMNEMGCRLYDELKNSDIIVQYAIDQSGVSSIDGLKVIDNTEEIEEVDAIIVCIMFAYEPVKTMLSIKTECPIESIKNVIFEERWNDGRDY